MVTQAQLNDANYRTRMAQMFLSRYPAWTAATRPGVVQNLTYNVAIVPAYYEERYWPTIAVNKPAPPISVDSDGQTYTDLESLEYQQSIAAYNAKVASETYIDRVVDDLRHLPRDFFNAFVGEPVTAAVDTADYAVDKASEDVGDLAKNVGTGLASGIMPLVLIGVAAIAVLLFATSKSGFKASGRGYKVGA